MYSYCLSQIYEGTCFACYSLENTPISTVCPGHIVFFQVLATSVCKSVDCVNQSERRIRNFCNLIGWHGSCSCNQVLQELKRTYAESDCATEWNGSCYVKVWDLALVLAISLYPLCAGCRWYSYLTAKFTGVKAWQTTQEKKKEESINFGMSVTTSHLTSLIPNPVQSRSQTYTVSFPYCTLLWEWDCDLTVWST